MWCNWPSKYATPEFGNFGKTKCFLCTAAILEVEIWIWVTSVTEILVLALTSLAFLFLLILFQTDYSKSNTFTFKLDTTFILIKGRLVLKPMATKIVSLILKYFHAQQNATLENLKYTHFWGETAFLFFFYQLSLIKFFSLFWLTRNRDQCHTWNFRMIIKCLL